METKKSRRGQAEFFGLVIIVFLLSIGLMFVIHLKSTKKVENIKSNYNDQTLSQNFINSILNMRTECREGIMPGLKMSQLITDCAEKRGAVSGSIRCDNGLDSCGYINETIGFLLDQTLYKWGKAYYFNISETEIEFSTRDCSVKTVGREPPGKQPIPIRGGTSLIFMTICKNN